VAAGTLLAKRVAKILRREQREREIRILGCVKYLYM
jgi:hypothetical protein